MASDYKQGDWLKHKATGYLIEITMIAEWPKQKVTKYYAEWRTGNLTRDEVISTSKQNLNEFFIAAPAAQVLLGNK